MATNDNICQRLRTAKKMRCDCLKGCSSKSLLRPAKSYLVHQLRPITLKSLAAARTECGRRPANPCNVVRSTSIGRVRVRVRVGCMAIVYSAHRRSLPTARSGVFFCMVESTGYSLYEIEDVVETDISTRRAIPRSRLLCLLISLGIYVR